MPYVSTNAAMGRRFWLAVPVCRARCPRLCNFGTARNLARVLAQLDLGSGTGVSSCSGGVCGVRGEGCEGCVVEYLLTVRIPTA